MLEELTVALLEREDVRAAFEGDPVGVLAAYGLGPDDLDDLAAGVEARTGGLDGPERRAVHGLLYLAMHATGRH